MTNTASLQIDELKRQLAQLDELFKQGVLSGDAARAKRDQLEHELIELVLRAKPGPAAAAAQPSARLLLGLTAFVLVFGAVGYAWRGNFEGLRTGPGDTPPAAGAAQDASGHAEDAQIEAMLNRLADKLKANPDDAQGWAMLARSYTARGRYDEAVPAYKKVVELLPKDAQALADYADGLATAKQGQLSGEPEHLVQQALRLDGRNVKALSLAGTIAFDRNDFKGAADYWDRALQAAEPDGNMARQLQGALTEARQRAGVTPPAVPAAAAVVAPTLPTPPTATAAVGATSITGRVDIAPALKAQLSPDDTLFVFARAPGGSRMPLAILRKKASELPFTFTLDDSLAMSPAARLSSAPQVVIGARISKSGEALPKPGDLQGLSGVVALGARDVQVLISEQIKP
ncbi:tetratricopeptide repeat protein [Paucibacter sp. KCTC 42545]|uniref:tetratricopeptide repeat protein n=1 Tax=Paucibacter sp. KCTC 42545 TaxID=1768242 RepID=UPI000A4F28BA|nr:tetratricopeptide repeat protein [Paucibacter sp. KCTC 42545]